MKDLLNKFLEKVGVQDYSQLTDAEKATYNKWEEILSKEVRIDDVADFIEGQIKRLSKELRRQTKEGEDRDALFTTARIENYEAILILIKEPTERRKALERQLIDNLK